MIHHQRRLTIKAAPDSVWAELQRFMHIHEFAPAVTRVEALSEQAQGQGAKRRCHFDNGGSMAEEVVRWNEGAGYRVRLSETESMPLVQAFAEIEIKPANSGQAEVVWSIDYQVKYGVLGWVMGQTMMKAMMGTVIEANLRGLSEKIATSS